MDRVRGLARKLQAIEEINARRDGGDWCIIRRLQIGGLILLGFYFLQDYSSTRNRPKGMLLKAFPSECAFQ